jgi:ATP-dependent DNA helicase HFM1/MER3
MKPNERPHLRDFNKSPFMKYALKDNISTTAHKVYVLIQVQLGGIDEPSTKDFAMVRRQFIIDKSIILERIARLVRCVVDCKSHDRDAIATRHALDLARSISAGYWEGSSLQLRQIAGIGPAAVRKLAASSINTIEKLVSLDTGTIERYMSKNPPFGKTLLDQLAGFPRLHLDAVITGKIIKSALNPKVHVKATLKYSNAKVPVWKKMRPGITFTAETTGGHLAHVWRGNVTQLEKGREVKFTVELSSSEDEIRCYVACEEIVGTVRCKLIRPELPTSAFPPPATSNDSVPLPHVKPPSTIVYSEEEDDYGSDQIEEAEMVAAAKQYDAPQTHQYLDGFEDIDDFELGSANPKLESKPTRTTDLERSTQMANGKWACNHVCRNNTLLKNGQHCKHRCCIEGLDKPRKTKVKVNNIGFLHRLYEADAENRLLLPVRMLPFQRILR